MKGDAMARTRRTKWHRRGAAVAELLIGFFTVLASAVYQLLVFVVSLLTRRFRGNAKVTAGGTSRSVSICGGKTSSASGLPRLFTPATVPTIRFNSVAGLGSAKEDILVRTVYPLRHPEEAAAYKLETGGGILFWGPPGCGKTLLAQAVAGELEADFYHVRASTLIDQWVGAAEKNVAMLFQQVRSHARSVLFIDEIDAICPSRRRNGSTVMRRVIAEFLSQMDGVDKAVNHGDCKTCQMFNP